MTLGALASARINEPGATAAVPSSSESSEADTKRIEQARWSPVYGHLADHDLLRLKSEMSTLREGAKLALTAELRKRGLENKEAEQESAPKYDGIGGWLGFFILSLVVISPMFTLVSLFNEWTTLNAPGQASSDVMPTVLIDFPLSLALMTFGIYAGVCLARIKSTSVRIAKAYLIALFSYHALAVLILIIGASTGPPASQGDAPGKFGPAARSIIYVIIWYSYLLKSKRVAATYPVPSK